MTKKYILFLLLILHFTFSILHSTLLEVSLDGSHPFTTIQSAIDAANNGDSILVYPGRYYENLVLLSRDLTITSRWLQTLNMSDVRNTIIDGNQSGSCVRIMDNSDIELIGFTITYGSGYDMSNSNMFFSGGGVFLYLSNLYIEKCIIEKNTCSLTGGGLEVLNSNIYIKGTTIRCNTGRTFAGGICVVGQSEVEFDQNDLCNVYMNYGTHGTDISKDVNSNNFTVYVDTFTVLQPTPYFISTSSYGWENNLDYSIQHGYIESVATDLYVSPDGDNENDGLTAETPLQSVYLALLKIQADAENPRNIYLSSGVYSESTSEQMFPLQLKGYVSLIGENMENTIIDCNQEYQAIKTWGGEYNLSVENISITNCSPINQSSGVISLMPEFDGQIPFLRLRNIKISESMFSSIYVISSLYNVNIIADHLIYENNVGRTVVNLGYCYNEQPMWSKFINSSFINNTGYIIGIGEGDTIEHEQRFSFINSEISNNYNPQQGEWYSSSCGIIIHQKRNVILLIVQL